ncbi:MULTISPECIES: toxin [unclassified Pseudomonas]|uniref:toxin n=1 Tax=unclassified Pseudomonas TaxID=196821 RepID=UPI0008C1E5BB|nr:MULTISPECIES: toxin [unclassified Pseudomonas]SEP96233.1 internalin A [Pseudomonas sp. NFPP19]
MKRINYNENTGDLEVPLDLLSDGILRAKKEKKHNIKIVAPNSNLNYEPALKPLINNENIFSIYIADDVNLKKINLEPLYSLKNIKKLSIQYFKGHIDFFKLPTLEILYITKADSEIDRLFIDGLKELLLVSIKNTDCSFISSLPNLKNLRISSAQIKSLSGVEPLDKLESLKLNYCPKLTDISSINKLKNLSSLHIEKCKNLNNFTPLSNNDSISDLFLSSADSLQFIPTMKHIKLLKFWDLKDGNLNFLLDSPSLERVDFYPQKKHYTHKKDEINNLIK